MVRKQRGHESQDKMTINQGIINLAIEIYNNTGGALVPGTLVYINGYHAVTGLPTVAKADADSLSTAAQFVVKDNIPDVSKGIVYESCIVISLDTSAAAAVGDPVYLSTIAGGFTFMAPTGTLQVAQVVGTVLVDDAANGQILFYPGRRILNVMGRGALQTQKAYFAVPAHRSSVASGQADVEVFEFTAPADLTLVGVQVHCSAVTATASVNVKEAGVSVLTGAVTPVANSVANGTISDSAIASGAAVTVHVTTDGTGTITNLTVTLIFAAAIVQ